MTTYLTYKPLTLSYMEKIHQQLKAIRIDRNLSQDDMADLLNKTQSSYARIERGATKLDIDTLFDFAKVLKMRPIDIITYPDIYVKKNEKNNILNEPLEVYKTTKENDNEISINIKLTNPNKKKEVLNLLFNDSSMFH